MRLLPVATSVFKKHGSLILVLLLLTGNIFAGTIPNKNYSGPIFSYVQNKGQIIDMSGKLCPDVLYKSNGSMADIYLRKNGISYVYSNLREIKKKVNEVCEKESILIKTEGEKKKKELMQQQMLQLHRVDMDFANCNGVTSMINEDEVWGCVNYYYPHCRDGITHIKQYNKITCKNIYHNIDVTYYANHESGRNSNRSNGLKYDIIVNPHADVNEVKLHWTGAEEISVESIGNADGQERLRIKTSVNEFFESIPRVYQLINGKVVDIKSKYILTRLSKGDAIISFSISDYDSNYSLVIDPASWITYYGGSGDEFGESVTTDGAGNPVFSGSTQSINFPVLGASQATLSGTEDAFVVKMTSAGTLVFATYFGGSGMERAYGIKADGNNDIYVTGYTTSTNLPTLAWGAAFMQPTNGGGADDAFVAKFSPAGTLLWSTYYGGSASDEGMDLTTDASNTILLTGSTGSANFPTLAAYQAVLSGSSSVFVVKFDNSGVRQWATYYGNNASDAPYNITVDAGNKIYVCGITKSFSFPVTASAFQLSSGGATDAFLFCFDSALGSPIWSTYYGGSGIELGAAVETDALGNVFMEIQTSSAASITTVGSYQAVYKGGVADVALIKFSNTGSRIWGTYLGGSLADQPTGIAVDANNNIAVAGFTRSTDFPVTSCALQQTYLGIDDQFITTFNQQGNLVCSSYIGQSSVSGIGGSLAVAGGYLYHVGYTGSNYPVTSGAFQTIYAGGAHDVSLAKLCFYTCGSPVTSTDFTSPVNVCINAPVNFTLSGNTCDTVATTYLWTFAGGTSSTSTSNNPIGISWAAAGNYDVSVKVMSPCDTFTVSKTNYITIISCCALTAQATETDNVKCNAGSDGSANVNISGGSGGTYTYSWSNGTIGITTSTTIPISGLSASTYSVTVIDAGCTATSSVTILQPNTLATAVLTTDIGCVNNGGSIVVIPSGGTPIYSYSWSNGITGLIGGTSATISNLATGLYSGIITDANGCSVTTSATINNVTPEVISVSPTQQTILSGNSVAITTSGGVSYSWSPAMDLSCNTCASPTAIPTTSVTYTLTVTDVNGCKITALIAITVKPPCENDLDIYIPNVFSPNNDGKNDVLTIEGNGIANIYWAIYDRWGNQLFEAFDQAHGWDGTKKGNALEAGTYVYYLKATCLKSNTLLNLKGSVSLVK